MKMTTERKHKTCWAL